jgi:hypothetical protein
VAAGELAEQARLANDALAEQAGESQLVTGLLVRIDLPTARRASSTPDILHRCGFGRAASIKFLWRLTPRSGCGRKEATACSRCHWMSATG